MASFTILLILSMCTTSILCQGLFQGWRNSMTNSPFGSVSNSPFGGFNSPFGASHSPFGGSNSPFAGSNLPFGGPNSPFGSASSSPFGGWNSPFGGSNSPFGGFNSPFGGSNSPFGSASNSPFSGFNSPFGASNSPFGGSNSPFGWINSPFGASNLPFGGSNLPFGGYNSPFGSASNSPFGGSNSPFGGSNSPFGWFNSPFGGSNSPFGGYNSPFGGSNSPFGGYNSPFGGSNSPFGGSNSLFGGSNSPFGGSNSPFGGSNSPFGGSNSQFGMNALPCSMSKSLNLDVSRIKLHIHDFKNNGYKVYTLSEAAAAILAEPKFNKNSTTLLYVPGYTTRVTEYSLMDIKGNLRNVPNSYLYIVDHYTYTNANSMDAYPRAVRYYFDIGRAVAVFLENLINGGVPLENVYVMGHSLGGHIIGAIGEVYQSRTGNLLPRLIGIDPAGPCFATAQTEFQLRSGIARHVEAYHCNSGQLGTNRDLTDADYYVNGGVNQPGCFFYGCSHIICGDIVTAPARNPNLYKAVQCNSYAAFQSGACNQNGFHKAGIFGDSNNKGKFYFSTLGM